MFNVLSIDFDYFVNVTSNYIFHYPDAIDLHNINVNQIIWSDHYGYVPDLYNININKKLIKNIKHIIDNQNHTIPVLITESHVDIFDFIMRFWNKNENMHITNIDFHHDMFNGNQTLDCGNWIQFVKQEVNNHGYEMGLRWIARQESLKIFGIESDKRMKRIYEQKIISTDLSIINNQQFDIIFLCRSDPWTPPHLDKHFIDLIDFITDYSPFGNVRIQDIVLNERQIYNFNMKTIVEQLMEKQNGQNKKTKNRR